MLFREWKVSILSNKQVPHNGNTKVYQVKHLMHFGDNVVMCHPFIGNNTKSLKMAQYAAGIFFPDDSKPKPTGADAYYMGKVTGKIMAPGLYQFNVHVPYSD